MADERELMEQEVDGVDAGDSDESAQPTADETSQRQPNGTDRRVIESEKTHQKINLDEYPEFREWKSKYDQRLTQMEQTYQRQLYEQQQQLRNSQLAEMDDYERLQYELQEERQAKALAYQRLQEVEVVTAKQRALSEVSQTMNVPLQALEQAQDINEAWRMAAQYQRQSEQRRAQEQATAAAAKAAARQDKVARNTVDTGSGAPPPSSDWDRQYQQFHQKKDPWGMFTHALNSSSQE